MPIEIRKVESKKHDLDLPHHYVVPEEIRMYQVEYLQKSYIIKDDKQRIARNRANTHQLDSSVLVRSMRPDDIAIDAAVVKRSLLGNEIYAEIREAEAAAVRTAASVGNDIKSSVTKVMAKKPFSDDSMAGFNKPKSFKEDWALKERRKLELLASTRLAQMMRKRPDGSAAKVSAQLSLEEALRFAIDSTNVSKKDMKIYLHRTARRILLKLDPSEVGSVSDDHASSTTDTDSLISGHSRYKSSGGGAAAKTSSSKPTIHTKKDAGGGRGGNMHHGDVDGKCNNNEEDSDGDDDRDDNEEDENAAATVAKRAENFKNRLDKVVGVLMRKAREADGDDMKATKKSINFFNKLSAPTAPPAAMSTVVRPVALGNESDGIHLGQGTNTVGSSTGNYNQNKDRTTHATAAPPAADEPSPRPPNAPSNPRTKRRGLQHVTGARRNVLRPPAFSSSHGHTLAHAQEGEGGGKHRDDIPEPTEIYFSSVLNVPNIKHAEGAVGIPPLSLAYREYELEEAAARMSKVADKAIRGVVRPITDRGQLKRVVDEIVSMEAAVGAVTGRGMADDDPQLSQVQKGPKHTDLYRLFRKHRREMLTDLERLQATVEKRTAVTEKSASKLNSAFQVFSDSCSRSERASLHEIHIRRVTRPLSLFYRQQAFSDAFPTGDTDEERQQQEKRRVQSAPAYQPTKPGMQSSAAMSNLSQSQGSPLSVTVPTHPSASAHPSSSFSAHRRAAIQLQATLPVSIRAARHHDHIGEKLAVDAEATANNYRPPQLSSLPLTCTLLFDRRDFHVKAKMSEESTNRYIENIWFLNMLKKIQSADFKKRFHSVRTSALKLLVAISRLLPLGADIDRPMTLGLIDKLIAVKDYSDNGTFAILRLLLGRVNVTAYEFLKVLKAKAIKPSKHHEVAARKEKRRRKQRRKGVYGLDSGALATFKKNQMRAQLFTVTEAEDSDDDDRSPKFASPTAKNLDYNADAPKGAPSLALTSSSLQSLGQLTNSSRIWHRGTPERRTPVRGGRPAGGGPTLTLGGDDDDDENSTVFSDTSSLEAFSEVGSKSESDGESIFSDFGR